MESFSFSSEEDILAWDTPTTDFVEFLELVDDYDAESSEEDTPLYKIKFKTQDNTPMLVDSTSSEDVEPTQLLIRSNATGPLEDLGSSESSDNSEEESGRGKRKRERPTAPSARQFRQNAVKFWLTYPQNDTTKEVALQRILHKFTDSVKWCVISEEKHADGSPHLHVALWLKKKLDIRSSAYWDFVGAKHGNYKVMLKPVQCVAYVIKAGAWLATEGFEPLVYTEAAAKKKGYEATKIAQLITAGKSIKEIDEDGHGGFLLLNLQRVKTYKTWKEANQTLFSDPSKSIDSLSQ